MPPVTKTIELEGIGTHWIIDLYGAEPEIGYEKIEHLIRGLEARPLIP